MLLCRITIFLALALCATTAFAFVEETELAGIHLGGGHSDSVREYANDGFELSDGTPVVFGDWYRSDWRDLQLTLVTPINANFGVLWGFGTGEQGGQYRIDPSLRLGFIVLEDLTPASTISFSTMFILGGRLREQACTADYGEIGGVQKVNCRLAASPMPPADTLELLWDEPPEDRIQMQFRYMFRF